MPRSKTVRVVVRVRPTDTSLDPQYYQVDRDAGTIEITVPKQALTAETTGKVESFFFPLPHTLLLDASQPDVFHEIVEKGDERQQGRRPNDMIRSLLSGYNGTILAYGQTGAGKTYSMSGVANSYNHRGLIPRCLNAVFEAKESPDNSDKAVAVKISYLELYEEQMLDLLTVSEALARGRAPPQQDLIIRQTPDGGVSVFEVEGSKPLRLRPVNSATDALEMFFDANHQRKTAAHNWNPNSSRSHCVFTIYVESRLQSDSTSRVEQGKLHLVDLAGSERVKNTGSEGLTLKEAAYINKSLSFLEQVVLALGDKRDHVPYRQSKLTYLLKDSLGGNAHTVMLANIWPERVTLGETASTLHFAKRMMRVESSPQPNIEVDVRGRNKQLERTIRELQLELRMHDTLTGAGLKNYIPTEEERNDLEKLVERYMEPKEEEEAGKLLSELLSDCNTISHHKTVFETFRQVYLEKMKDVARNPGRGTVGGGGGDMGDTSFDPVIDAEPVEEEDADGGLALGQAADGNIPKQEGGVEFDADPSPSKELMSPTGAGFQGNNDKDALFKSFKMDPQGMDFETKFRRKQDDLARAKKTQKDLLKDVNDAQGSIKRAADELEAYQARLKPGQNESGVIDHEEFVIRAKVRDAKKDMRSKYKERENVQAQAARLDKEVKGAKRDLVDGFHTWCKSTKGVAFGDISGADLQDVDEQFGDLLETRLEKQHPNDESYKAFYQARKEYRLKHPRAHH